MVIGDLGVIEDLAGLDHPILIERMLGMLPQVGILEGLEGRLHRRKVVLGKIPRVGTRVGQHLVVLIKSLGKLKSPLRAEAEAAVRLALQGGQIVEQG